MARVLQFIWPAFQIQKRKAPRSLLILEAEAVIRSGKTTFPIWESAVCWFVRCPEFHVGWLQKGGLENRGRLVRLLPPCWTSHLSLSEKFWPTREGKENSPGVTLENLLASPHYGTAGLWPHGTISTPDLYQSIPFICSTWPRSVWKIDKTNFSRVLKLLGYWGGLRKGLK